MGRYDRNYDFGMRGYPQTTRPLTRGRMGFPDPEREYAMGRGMDRGVPLPNRVTERYNRDYLTDRPSGYRRSYAMYGGDRSDRTGDPRIYRRPYITNGGSWTMRGASFPTPYDYPDYGPNYGGRYPDEL